MKAPPEMRERVWKEIREKEAARMRESLCDEDKELLRLGQIYKKKRKHKKYFLLAAVMVLVLAFGITSVGGPEILFDKITWMMGGRKQTNVDSDSENVKPMTNVSEEEVYEEIEDKFGFYPVRLNYLPDGIEFQEMAIYDEIQGINLVYVEEDMAKIIYLISPNYRAGSWGQDMEDNLIDEYEMQLERTIVKVANYQIEDETLRWRTRFEFQDVSYAIIFLDMDKQEVEKILQNLYFSK